MKIDINQFKDLKEQIYNPKMWGKELFIVFDYEAGTGKSLFAQRYIGEMTKKQQHKVLYVQRFSRDEELNNTADTINDYAGKNVAVAYTSKDYTDKQANQKKLRAINSQVLCITHKMYSQICKGEHKELSNNRDILIIDEYPDLVEKISISQSDLTRLWFDYGHSEIEKVVTMLRDRLKGDSVLTINHEIKYHSFESVEYDYIKKAMIHAMDSIEKQEHKAILQKCVKLLNNGGYAYEGGFHTYDDSIDFVMLKNNIILDANAGFDHRYEMSNKFVVRKQEKMFEYANSRVHHIDVNTTKKALSKYVDFAGKVLETVQLEQRKGVLFVTDKANKDELNDCILRHYSNVGETIEEIEETLECKISVDYFGNIIGVNTYRDYETVVIMKTPNYDYLTYVLTGMLYKSKDGLSVESIRPFQDDEIETLRKTIVAGEIYQAIKRINRDNSQSAEIFVFSDSQEAVELVVKQLPNVSYTKSSMEVSNKRKDYDASSRLDGSAVTEVQEILTEALKAGVERIKKKEIREQVGVTKSYFPKVLNKLTPFLTKHNISIDVRELIFDKSA